MAARRTVEERVEEIMNKISKKHTEIEVLEAKRQELIAPKPKKKALTMKAVIAKAKEDGMTPEEIAKKLGVKIEA